MKPIRLALAVAALGVLSGAPAPAADGPSCHAHELRSVGYRGAGSTDTLEVSIGEGPCSAATLTIVIRDEGGNILYLYANDAGRHITETATEAEYVQSARDFVKHTADNAMGTTAELAPWAPEEQFAEENASTILIPKEDYERLRANPQPMISHATYHEGWVYAVYDRTTGKSTEVLSGGV